MQYQDNEILHEREMAVIFATAMTIGIIVGMMRSAASVAIVAALMGLAFLAALFVSSGPVSFLSLVLAIAGYNFALLGHVVALLTFERGRRQQAQIS